MFYIVTQYAYTHREEMSIFYSKCLTMTLSTDHSDLTLPQCSNSILEALVMLYAVVAGWRAPEGGKTMLAVG